MKAVLGTVRRSMSWASCCVWLLIAFPGALAAPAGVAAETCTLDQNGSPRCSGPGRSGGSTTPGRGGGGAAGGASAAEEKVLPTADVISQELAELQGMVNLCEDRIGLLEDLRSTITSGHNVSLPESHLRAFNEKFPLVSDVTEDEDSAPSSSADDHLILKTVVSQEEEVSHIAFLPLRSSRSSPESTTEQTTMPSSLLVAVQVDGTCRLFLPCGELVLTFSLGHEQPVTLLAVSPSHDEYFVTTGDARGIIRVHKVDVRQRRLTKDEKESRQSTADDKVSQFLGSQVNITAKFSKQFQVPAGSDGEWPRLSALAVVSHQGNKFFVAGDAEGQISIFTRNGTFQGKVDGTTTPDSPGIESLYPHVGSLLFRAGSEWGFVSLDRLEVQRMDCPNFEGRATAVVVDSQQTSRILVADEYGAVWVLNVKNRQSCKVEHRFAKGIARAPVDLASVRGYTIAVERASVGAGLDSKPLSVFALNMSHVGKKREALSLSPSPVVWRSRRAPVRDWAIMKRYQQGDLLAFLSDDGREIEVLELLMQVYQAPPSEDTFGDFKFPVIAVALVLVLGYQYTKQKGKWGGGKSSKKFDWDNMDLPSKKSKLDGMGLKGAGLGGLGKK